MATNNSTNTPKLISDGQLFIGSTGNNPGASTLTAGPGVVISNGPASISISSPGAGDWVNASGSVIMTTNTGYTANAAFGHVTFGLPSISQVGDFVEINGKTPGLFSISINPGQSIHYGNITTSPAGSVAATQPFDCIRLRCITTNAEWSVVSAVGNFDVT